MPSCPEELSGRCKVPQHASGKTDTTGVNGIAQEVQFGFAKVTFGRVYDKPVVR